MVIALCATAALFGVTNLSFAGGVTNWIPTLKTGSKGEGAARPAMTSLTVTPATFSAACTSSSSESAVLTWTTAGSAVTGYEIFVSATSTGTYALDTTQPSGTTLTVNETYSSSTTGKKYYRLEAKSLNWPFPGTTVTNAREASVSGTNGGFLTMAGSGTECEASA
jgi:hypothetical protein